jgi:DnaJ-class molecular chaperone
MINYATIIIILVAVPSTCLVHAGEIPDPYQVLGVSPSASAKEIQKQYRKLCLKYHPDKSMNSSLEQRKKHETRFKRVQEAYSTIHNRNIDGHTSGRTQPSPYGRDPVAEAFFRAFDMKGRPRPNHSFFFQTGPSPTATRFGMGFPFATDINSKNSSPMMPSELSFKSIYVQTVQVPLEKLYRGVKRYPLRLQDNLWTRYKAAWKGKILFLSWYQGMLYSAPIFRINAVLAVIVGLFIMHSTLPRPSHHHRHHSKAASASKSLVYTYDLRPGTKECTIKFASTRFGQPEVIFKLVDEPHPCYRRIDNDLHTTVYISEDEAQQGCMLRIDALDPSEGPLEVVIPAQVYSYTKQQQQQPERRSRHDYGTLHRGHSDIDKTLEEEDVDDECCYVNTVIIPNRGWPKGNADLKGDVVVTVLVKKPRKFRR